MLSHKSQKPIVCESDLSESSRSSARQLFTLLQNHDKAFARTKSHIRHETSKQFPLLEVIVTTLGQQGKLNEQDHCRGRPGLRGPAFGH